MVPVTYWRWVDVASRPELAELVVQRGPIEGQCPTCHRTVSVAAPWVAINGRAGSATLILGEDRRAHLIDELQNHLATLRARPEMAEPWLLTPQVEFVTLGEENTTRRRAPLGVEDEPGAPEEDTRPRPVAAPEEVSVELEAIESAPVPSPAAPAEIQEDAGVPQLIGTDPRTPASQASPFPNLGGHVCDLLFDEGTVVVAPDLRGDTAARWREAKLEARPIHLRGAGYPLVGVRVVGAWMGQVGCIDAVIDPGSAEASDVFRILSQTFSVRVLVPGDPPLMRDVAGPGLEPNAALCLESARGVLAQGEYPPEDFDRARAVLAEETVEARLAPSKLTVASGAYAHIIGAREAMAALDHLDRISRKEVLSRLLEVEGLKMGEYDAIRRRVLEGALAHGLVAPRRFWRRVVASGLARDLEDYARQLADNRALHEGEEGDLEEEQRIAAWQGILELCRRKGIRPPAPLRRALDLPDVDPPSPPGTRSAAGEIVAEETSLDERLRDPDRRLRTAADLLQGRASGDEVEAVIEALDVFDADELLAILPDLSDLGPRAVPGLVRKLGAKRREVRQAAAILLGMALDPDALEPLAERLVVEETNVWLDVARSLGAFGPVALRRLCQILRREEGTEHESRVLSRVARALAEVALSDGDTGVDDPRPGHDAVAALAESGDPRVSAAARLALATLREVRESGAAIRGDLPLTEVTEVRGFARRAYEAIMVPELEVEAEG